MRKRMVGFRNSNLRIRTSALLLGNHESDDAGEIGSESEKLKIQHQRKMILEYRRRSLRLRDRWQFDIALFLRALNTAFDVANRVGVFRHPGLIGCSEFLLEARELSVH